MSDPAKALEAFRRSADLSQSALGLKIDASQAQVSRILSGGLPTISQAVAIERVAGIAVDAWGWTGPVAAFVRRLKKKAV